MTVLFVILAIIFVILMLPVGVIGAYDFGDIEMKAVLGPIKLQILPAKPKKEKSKTEKPKKEKKKKEKKPREKPIITLEIIKDYLNLASDALGSLRKKLSINKLHLYYLVASDDPCKSGITYGLANAAVYEVLVLLDCMFNVKEQDVRIKVDFMSEKSAISVGADITIRIWQILYIGITAGIGFLKIILKQRKLKKLTIERIEENGEASDKRRNGDNNGENQGNGGRQYSSGDTDNNA